MNREALLTAEFLRPAFPGLRKFSAATLSNARSLGLTFALPPAQQRKLSAAEADAEMHAAAWLLDAAQSTLAISQGVALGRERFFAEILPDYRLALAPAKLMFAQREIELASTAIELAAVIIQPKPGDEGGPTPPGN